MYYHEPWYDEAQAWLIARDATIKELLSSITHFEGHAPLWFLILMPFAKSGIPFEIGIKLVNFIFIVLAMGIFIFKAPFPKTIRCSVPFTYFFFYQYGVISRPYSMLMLGFILSALLYKHRNEKPFRFILALSLVCASSAYGMLIAGGIAIVWLFEIFGKSFSWNSIKAFLGSRRFYALLTLFVFNVLLVCLLYPFPGTYATTVKRMDSVSMLLYIFFIAPLDAVCCSSVFSNNTLSVNTILIIGQITISCIIHIIVFVIAKIHHKRALFIVPYLIFALFVGFVYFYIYHIGVITIFYMFLFWCFFNDKPKEVKVPKIVRHSGGREKKYFCIVSYTLLSVFIGISIYCTTIASIHDINLNFGTGRDAAEFIKNNKLDQMTILTAWPKIEERYGMTTYDYNSLQGISALPYFDKNIYINLNHQLNNRCYLTHQIDRDGTYTKSILENVHPQVLILSNSSHDTFGDRINMDDYVLVKSVHGNMIWKDSLIESRQFIFIRKDLLNHYPNIQPLNWEEEKLLRDNDML